MKLRKVNRERRPIFFTDSEGNRRQAVVYFDDLRGAKKPPAWMQEILYSRDAGDDAAEKGA